MSRFSLTDPKHPIFDGSRFIAGEDAAMIGLLGVLADRLDADDIEGAKAQIQRMIGLISGTEEE